MARDLTLRRRFAAPGPGAIAAVVLAALFAWHASRFQHITSDTASVLHGVGVIDRCLDAHDWSCGKAGFGSIGPSALLQYLPGLAFKRLGMSFDDALHGLALLNTAAFVGVLVLLWRTGRRVGDVRLAALLALMAVASPLLWYGSSGFGEGLGVFFVTAFTCAVVTRANGVLLGLTLWAAAISKEPALPFLLAMAFVVLRHPPDAGGPRLTRGQAIGLAVAAALALATNVGFNAFREAGGVAAARPLTSSLTHTGVPAPTLAQKAEAATGLFVAPNAGLLWFWPAALGCIALGLIAAWRTSPSLRAFIGSPAVGSLGVLLVLTAGIASYLAPYGFSSWGPRYLVPWLPSFALMALYKDWPTCLALLDRLRRNTAAALAVAAAILILGLSQLASFLNPVRAYDHFFAGGACPTPLMDPAQWFNRHGEIGSYYRCTRYLAWTKGPLLAQVDEELAQPSSGLYLVLYMGGVVTLMGVAAGVLPRTLPRRRRPATV